MLKLLDALSWIFNFTNEISFVPCFIHTSGFLACMLVCMHSRKFYWKRFDFKKTVRFLCITAAEHSISESANRAAGELTSDEEWSDESALRRAAILSWACCIASSYEWNASKLSSWAIWPRMKGRFSQHCNCWALCRWVWQHRSNGATLRWRL